jgi:hypothetical protein
VLCLFLRRAAVSCLSLPQTSNKRAFSSRGRQRASRSIEPLPTACQRVVIWPDGAVVQGSYSAWLLLHVPPAGVRHQLTCTC